MSMNWKPDVWATLAQERPDIFLKELSLQRTPSASLFTKTYLQCAIQGFRALSKHQNTQYEETFFIEMAKRLPHEDAQRPEKFEVGSIQHLHTDRTPVECLLWRDALAKRLNPAEKLNFHGWLLELRKPSYESDNYHDHFSLKNAPVWAAAYTKIQRGKSADDLLAWLADAPIAQSLGVLNAAGSLHAEEKPMWLTRGLEVVFSRPVRMHQEGTVYDIVCAMSHAWNAPSARLDGAVVEMVCAQEKGLSMMGHAWFGGHYVNKRYTLMLDWWVRQSPQERGLVLHHWLVKGSQWDSLCKEDTHEKKPGLALDMFTRLPVDLPSELAKEIVASAPFERMLARTHLARVIPAIHAAELTVEPKDFKSYLLNSWDMLHEKGPILSIDGLLDLQP